MTTNLKQLESLQIKREQAAKRVTRIGRFISEYNAELNHITEVEARIEALKDSFIEFSKYQSEIEENVSLDKIDDETNKAAELENIYFKALAQANSLIKESSSKTIIKDSENTVISANKLKISLPPINIIQFNGSLDNWLHFRDLFISLIHENVELSNIEKMHYLISSLKDEARRAIEGLSISANNYEQAWSLLLERFNNEKLIIQTHIKKIINMPAINKANSVNLRQIVDNVRNNLAALGTLGEPIQHWDSLLITIITDKFDFHTAREWQSIFSNCNNMPPLSKLIQFLESRTQHLESISYNTPIKTNSTSNLKSVSSNFKSFLISNNNQLKKLIFVYFVKNRIIFQTNAVIS